MRTLSTKVIVSVSENWTRPRLLPPGPPPPKNPPPPPPRRPPPPKPPKPPPDDGGCPLAAAGGAVPPGGPPAAAAAPLGAPAPRFPKPNCCRIWSITACDGRRDFSGWEKSKPIRSVSRRELSKLTG